MTKLSYRQKETLRDLKTSKDALAAKPNDYREGGTLASNTNSTMNALERRGLVKATYRPNGHPWVPLWVITELGEALLTEK